MRLTPLLAWLASLFLLTCCESREAKEERLAKQYCGSCHLFPEPTLLDKNTWKKGVLPQMAFRMGLDNSLLWLADQNDVQQIASTLPDKPMVTEQEWKAIENYFITRAPDSLHITKATPVDSIHQFDAQKVKLPIYGLPLLTSIAQDAGTNNLWIANRWGRLYRANASFELEDSLTLPSPAASIMVHNNKFELLCMGIMDPNDQRKGQLVSLVNGQLQVLIDSLKRPVFFAKADLNNDKTEDYIIANFGNYTGSLDVYENDGRAYTKHVIHQLPGTRRVIVKDVNQDGLQDMLALITQGNEQVTLFVNEGNFTFSAEVLKRFPPSYGSSYFDYIDVTGDGKEDIIYSNGDNADYSQILKPYHGLRIFEQLDNRKFEERWFYPMHGASQFVVNDFDEDGDHDIAAISFFPDYNDHPEQSFLYFENRQGNFIAQATPRGNAGKWITLESFDYDQDEDVDIILGALDFIPGVPDAVSRKWRNERTSLLVLTNKLRQPKK